MVYPYSVLKKKDRALYGEDSEDLGIPPAQPVVPDSENIAVEPPAQKAFDPQAELYNYLMQRKRSREYDLTPEAMAAKNARGDASAGLMAMNTLIPTLEKAGAEIGTVGGRTAKTILDKPSEQWIKYNADQEKNDQFDRKMSMDETSMDDRLVEYLLNQQRQKEEADTGRGFQLERDKIQHSYGMEKQGADAAADMAKLDRQQQWKSGEGELERGWKSGEEEKERGWKSGESEKDRAARLEAARIAAQAGIARVQEQGAQQRKTNIEKPKAGGSVDKVVQRGNSEIDYRVKTIKDSAAELKKIIKEKGTMDLFGTEGSHMDSLIYQMAIDFAKAVDPQSVAREGEVAAAQKYTLPVRKYGGARYTNDQATKIIDNYIQDLDRRVAAHKSAFGGQEKPQAQNDVVRRIINKAAGDASTRGRILNDKKFRDTVSALRSSDPEIGRAYDDLLKMGHQ